MENIYLSRNSSSSEKFLTTQNFCSLLFSQRMHELKSFPLFIEIAAFLFVCNEVLVKLWSILSWNPLTKHVDGMTELMNLKLCHWISVLRVFSSSDRNFYIN